MLLANQETHGREFFLGKIMEVSSKKCKATNEDDEFL
jgi:hypothetical protein